MLIMNPGYASKQSRADVCLLVMSGLPGSGKTSLARALAQQAAQHGVEVRHVCFDDHGCQPGSASGCGSSGGGDRDPTSAASDEAFSPEAWQLARKEALSQLQAQLGLQGGELSRQQQQLRWLVIADDNMQYRSMRGQCYSLARAAGTTIVLLYLRCSEQLAQQRNAARPPVQRVPRAAISRMAVQFEEPGDGSSGDGDADVDGELFAGSCGTSSSSGNSWEQGCLVTWSSELAAAAASQSGPDDRQQQASLAALWQRIWQLWGPPVPPPYDAQAVAAAREAGQAATAASQVHAADLATRKILSQCMQRLGMTSSQRKTAAAQRLNAVRRQVLEQVQAAEEAASGSGSAGTAATGAEHWAALFQQQCESALAAL